MSAARLAVWRLESSAPRKGGRVRRVALRSRRPGGERGAGGVGAGGGGDIGRCWAGAKAGREELLLGRAGRTELPANEGLEEDGRP